MFEIPDITTIIPSPALVPSADLSVGLGGTTTPYPTHGVRSGHIPPSTTFVEDFHSLHSILTPVFILTGVVVDTRMLGLHLTFLIRSHCPLNYFL